MKKILLLSFIMPLMSSLIAQSFDRISFTNTAYNSHIKSIELYKEGYEFAFPIITLNSNEKLILCFDDLDEEGRYLKYTFIHCTHDWKPDGMNQIEYLEGFTEDEITDYEYSFNTITSYTHYSLVFPGEMMRITKSGNYILFVYDETPETPVLTRRFVVQEEQVADISGEVKQASDVTYMFSKQEVDFLVHTGGYSVKNPAQYLHAVILQNGRWDNAITGLRYRSGKPGEYSFDYDDNQNAFNGGSEFRDFDTKSLKYNGTHIVSIGYYNQENQAFVVEDLARPYGAYVSENTINGKCYFKNEDYEGRNRQDYINTYFTLRVDFPVTDGKLYVFGELTDWRILKNAELKPNPKTGLWETSLLLKQGFYNYQYVFVKNGTNLIDETYIEGSHWETRNDYYIFLYLQEEGNAYDKLIGFKTLQINH